MATLELTCGNCGSPFELKLGRFGQHLTLPAFEESAVLCDSCAGVEIDEIEQLEARRLVAEAARRRVDRSGLPPELREVAFHKLDGVPASALHSAEAWAQEAAPTPGLLLSGPVGVGKTWIAAAAARQMLDHRPVTWVSAARMLIQVSAAFGDEDRAVAIGHLTGDGPLVIDDLDKVGTSDWVRQHLYSAIDNRLVAGTPLLVTTNLTLAGVERKLGAAIASRLEGYCRVVSIAGPDRRRLRFAKAQAEGGF